MSSPLRQDEELGNARPGSWAVVVVAWLLVGLPLLWGVWQTVRKASQLFK
jgi:hypothetical protein